MAGVRLLAVVHRHEAKGWGALMQECMRRARQSGQGTDTAHPRDDADRYASLRANGLERAPNWISSRKDVLVKGFRLNLD